MKENNGNITINFISLLTLVFIVLKLCKVINWSWWWVLSPFWLGLALNILIIVIVVLIMSIKRVK